LARPHRKNGPECVEEQPGPVLDAAAVLIGAKVHRVEQELQEEVNEAALNLYAVEPRPFCVGGGGSEVLDDLFDVVERHRFWYTAHDDAVVGVDEGRD
jgi:hypothetical protein